MKSRFFILHSVFKITLKEIVLWISVIIDRRVNFFYLSNFNYIINIFLIIEHRWLLFLDLNIDIKMSKLVTIWINSKPFFFATHIRSLRIHRFCQRSSFWSRSLIESLATWFLADVKKSIEKWSLTKREFKVHVVLSYETLLVN